MDVKKECMVCSQTLATQQCTVCGRLVCDAHFNSLKGTCTECLTKQAP